MSSAKHEHCPTRTWRRPQGRGQGILRTRRQATSKDRLAPLSRQRCCWTLRWGWRGGCLFWKLKKLFLQRASTWNSDKAFDSLFFCRFLQDLLRAVHGRAPQISYLQDNSDLSNFSKRFFVTYLYCWILSQVWLWLLEEWCQGSLHPTCVITWSDLISNEKCLLSGKSLSPEIKHHFLVKCPLIKEGTKKKHLLTMTDKLSVMHPSKVVWPVVWCIFYPFMSSSRIKLPSSQGSSGWFNSNLSVTAIFQ